MRTAGQKHVAWRVLAVLAMVATVLSVVSGPAAAHDTDDFEDVALVSIASATDFDWLPDGRILVTQKDGRLRIVNNTTLLPTPVIDLSAIVCDDIERGLVGITLHPDFVNNGWVYLYYTYSKHGNCGQSEVTGPANRASRFTMVGDTIDPATELILFETPELYGSNHNSGYMEFGNDGFLYVSVGDSNAPRVWGRPQDPGYLLGKIIRITDDGDIPVGNPFTGPSSVDCSADGTIPSGSTATECQQVFAMGLRNPFRMAFNPNAVGTEFYINDVGQTLWEEINLGVAGADYGWPSREGPCAFGSLTNCSVPAGKVDPIHWYVHDGGAAITGGAFVPDGLWPSEYDGTYVYGDYATEELFVMEPGGDDCRTCDPPTSAFISDEFSDAATRIIGLRFGPHGDGQALYALFGSTLHRIAYVGDANRTPVAKATATPNAGALPLPVAFTGSTSTDPDDDPLLFQWDFGDGATSTVADPTHTYTTAGTYYATLTVDDQQGGIGTATVRIDPGNNAPAVSIDAPTAAFEFAVGDSITLTGSAIDPEEGALPASAMTWEVVLHHNTHIHPYVAPTTGNNLVITAPAPEDLFAAQDSYLEVILTGADSQGVATTVTRDVQPDKVDLTINTVPVGLDIGVSGFTVQGGDTVTSWAGHQEAFSAATQDFNGQTYYWTGWSDGLGPTHTVAVGTSPATYTATFSTTPPLAIISAGVGSVVEGNAGQVSLDIPVTLQAQSGSTVTANWTTTAGFTSAEPEDYVASSGVVTFVPGQTQATITVPVVGDSTYELTERLMISMSNPVNGVLGGFYGLGFGDIVNDDAVPTVTPGSATVVEGNSGTTTVSVPVTMPVSEVAATVHWSTTPLQASPSDLVAKSGSLTFAPGETVKTAFFQVVGDTIYEPDELVAISLSTPTNAKIGGFFGLGFVQILNDDPLPKIIPGSVTATEGNAGTTAVLVPFTLTNASQTAITASWTTRNHTATTPSDYVAASGTITFAPGQTSATVPIQIVGDTIAESQEIALISLTQPVGAKLGGFFGLGFVVINDDDGP